MRAKNGFPEVVRRSAGRKLGGGVMFRPSAPPPLFPKCGGTPAGPLLELPGKEENVFVVQRFGDLANRKRGFPEQLHGPHGFGFCGQFEGLDGSDYAFVIRNNTIHKMPHGYHTVTAAPGYKIWYLAVYAGLDKRHKPFVHPDHAGFRRNSILADPNCANHCRT